MKTTELLAIFAAIALWGCTEEVAGIKQGEDSQWIDVPVEATIPSTRSSTGISNEATMNEIRLLAYRTSNGMLDGQATVKSGKGTLKLIDGQEYTFVAVANMGSSMTYPGDLASLITEKISFSGLPGSSSGLAGLTAAGIPMVGMSTAKAAKGVSVTLSLSRLAAKYEFSFIDKDNLGYKVKSVRLMQAANTCTPFSEGFKATSTSEVSSGDYASDSDVTSLAEGGKAVFYAMENMQGTLLDGNTDEWSKTPSKLSAVKSGLDKLCTYLEVGLQFPSNDKNSYSGTVIYRIYLGQDLTTNFDVSRNTSYRIVMKGTENGLSTDSWRVDSSDVTWPAVATTLDAPEYMAQKGTISIPSYASLSSCSITLMDNTDKAALTSNGNGSYTISAKRPGTVRALVTAARHHNDTISFTIKAPVLKLNRTLYRFDVSHPIAKPTATYTGSGGEEIVFDNTLYNSLKMKPVIKISTSASVGSTLIRNHFKSYGDSVGMVSGLSEAVKKLYLDNGTVSGGILAGAKGNSDIANVTADILVTDFFADYRDVSHGTVNDWKQVDETGMVRKSGYSTTASINIGNSFNSDGNITSVSSSLRFRNDNTDYDGLTLTDSGNGKFSVTAVGTNDRKAGKLDLTLKLSDKRYDVPLSGAAGYVDVYLHSVIGLAKKSLTFDHISTADEIAHIKDPGWEALAKFDGKPYVYLKYDIYDLAEWWNEELVTRPLRSDVLMKVREASESGKLQLVYTIPKTVAVTGFAPSWCYLTDHDGNYLSITSTRPVMKYIRQPVELICVNAYSGLEIPDPTTSSQLYNPVTGSTVSAGGIIYLPPISSIGTSGVTWDTQSVNRDSSGNGYYVFHLEDDVK